ncbi:4-oxalocrotonate decarboxylase [Prauserella sp. PE36]|uniref:4-oxalocrotonate decarboxylase n=1 Tax=Prauserella endophytica TaxID=1592324 RepID=A0ABY2S9A4_9PSEU|nr:MULTISPECIES: fumarylacetoacetate hydrolase family protein [Prauserella]PXY23129.1 4-oxalocrotonate decarboxylase [Prauserella coralliicola]RBM17113.1 4-oxalocrotonate decarboxylase [Prauserella sp. PE36]TKG72478.1 4-oxalocrotonate decarboxylase [Prauserella endophytica]
MTLWTVDHAAHVLAEAERARTERPPITSEWPELDLRTAYQVQHRLIDHKTENGEQVVGVKLGLTSRAKQRRMNIDSPLTAWLTDRMSLPAGQPLDTAALIHPRVEPEIVFVLGHRLAGPGVTATQALAAVSEVRAGLEVIDSRYTDYKFTLPDVVADNASSAGFLVGAQARRPEELALELEGCVLDVDGEIVDTATGAAVQGHPAEALALAANSLWERGVALEPGWIVLTGGLTDAVPARPGSSITARFAHLGTVTLGCS